MPTDYSQLPLEELQALQAHHRDQMAANRRAVEERKARTRRLIRNGAILEKYLSGSEFMSEEELEAVLQQVLG